MKKFTRIIAALMVAVLLVAFVPAAYAAEYKGNPGKSVSVTFSVSNIAGIDGTVSVSDPNGIVASSSITGVSSGGLAGDYNASTGKIYYYGGANMVNFSVTYTVNLKAGAADGSSCTVTLNYGYTDENYELVDGRSMSHTVVVDVPETETTKPAPDTTTQPPVTVEPKPDTSVQPPVTNPVDTTKPAPVVTTKQPTEPTPSEPAVTVDYTELKKQIARAEGLDLSKYTAESWAKVETALQAAKNALSSQTQAGVDAAAKALSNAIDALVEIDYTALKAAIEKANTFIEDNKVANSAKALIDALSGAMGLLESTDQAAIDAAAKELETLLAEIEALVESLSTTETIVEKVEVEVEVEPKDPFCNISIHYVWPILFFISLALNVAFIIIIVVYFARKKKNQTDDTPLIDYNIDDDAK